ncbi:four-helix bundle copper-binding protein [Haloimpatiens sp. FM7330]|uniref:four-helix bundle copper-binding protein n=1 Tax=Haloimpatiens sp. FM7330 TaxID=3298610 RepID=UPI003645B3F6
MISTVTSNQIYQKCIDMCFECAQACEFCATSCLNEPDPKTMERCIKLDRDCADICTISAQYMARDSEFSIEICSVCAKICRACGTECAKFPQEHCKNCEDICNRCATECENMAR